MSNHELRILLPENKEAILNLGRQRLARDVADEMEREMLGWNARWRPEALDHYLPQGWSFGAFNAQNELEGALLAQPYLFHRGLTQTLWIEEILVNDTTSAHALLETAYRWARDKHFQTVLAEDLGAWHGALRAFPRARRVEESMLELPSTKF